MALNKIMEPPALDKTLARVASALEVIAGNEGDVQLDAIYAAMLDGTNTTNIFRQWWPLSNNGTDTKYARLSRFARMMAAAGQDLQYTLRAVDPETGDGTTAMTPLDDLAGLSAAQLCTDTTTPVADWADEGLIGGWYVRANALSLADGTMNVLAVEGVDATFDLTGDLAPVYTFSPALWLRTWTNGGYMYKSWRLTQAGGYVPYAGDVAPDNTKRDLTWHPSFPGGYDSNGKLGSGVGQKPYIRKSASAGNTSAKTLDAYEGLRNDSDAIHVLDMWQLRHFDLENSSILEGCTGFTAQYTVAAAETGVRRVLLTAAQAANYFVGCNVSVGTHPSGTNTDRGTAANFDIADCATITKIESVTVDGNTYSALYLDVSSDLTVPATAYVSSMPWSAGDTECLPGHKDGCRGSLTDGKTPIRVMGIEMMHGAYDIGLDPLYDVTNFANQKGDYAVYECRNSEKLASSITSDYIDTGITYTQMQQGWNYVKAFARTTKAILFPAIVGGSSSKWYKSAFNGPTSAGVRCPWRYAPLYGGAAAGLACENGNVAPGNADWAGRPRLGGAGKKRGEWPA